MRHSVYVKSRDNLVVQVVSTSKAPDALDDCRVAALRAFERAILIDCGSLDDIDPGMVDTTDLPTVD